jgi:hypothetical protein
MLLMHVVAEVKSMVRRWKCRGRGSARPIIKRAKSKNRKTEKDWVKARGARQSGRYERRQRRLVDLVARRPGGTRQPSADAAGAMAAGRRSVMW